MSLADTAATMDGAFTIIPTIDFGKCGTPEGRLATVNEIRDACTKDGVFYLRDHGIPPSCLDNIRAVMQSYFDLPMTTKMKLYHRTTGKRKGYAPPLDSNLDPSTNPKGDYYETFEIGWEDSDANAYDKMEENEGAVASINVWPSDGRPEFRGACLAYYHAAMNIGRQLYPLFSLALGQAETFFDDKSRHSTTTMKLLHYPTQDGHPEIGDNTPGLGAHTDFECFTILWQQPGVQALQIKNSECQWVDVPAIENTLVVNISDYLAIWTNDVFKPPIHRAINKSGKERYSIPVFFGTDGHVKIEPLANFVSEDRPAKYDPITAAEYVRKRFKDMYHGI